MPIQNPLGTRPGGNASVLNIMAPMVISRTPGTTCSISVTGSGSADGALYDSISVDGNDTTNQIGVIPRSATNAPLLFDWPCEKGIVIAPGAGQILAVAITGRAVVSAVGLSAGTQQKQNASGTGALTISGAGAGTQKKQNASGTGNFA